MTIDYPHDQVTEASKHLLARGIKILQGNRLGDTDERHVAALMSYMDLPQDVRVVDIGCGFGEVTRLMGVVRPDLRFHLVNNNEFQMQSLTHEGCEGRHFADMHALPIPDGFADVVMFCYSFCHSYPVDALEEAARVAKPGGHLFIYDYERTKGTNDLTLKHLAAKFYNSDDVAFMAMLGGWGPVTTIYPRHDDTVWRQLIGSEAANLLYGLRPVIWKAVKPC